MAWLSWSCNARYGQTFTWDADMDHYFLNHHAADGSLCPLLDQSDIYNELHHAVCDLIILEDQANES